MVKARVKAKKSPRSNILLEVLRGGKRNVDTLQPEKDDLYPVILSDNDSTWIWGMSGARVKPYKPG